MIIELALDLALNAVAAIPRASLSAYTALRNRKATGVSFGRARRVALAKAADGHAVRVRGSATLAEPHSSLLRAPVSGEPCAAWSLRIHRREVLWKEEALLHLVLDAGDARPLIVTEGDRVARLDGLVDLDVTPQVFDGRELADSVPAELARLLRERDLDESFLTGCEVHEHRLTLPLEVEVGGIASVRLRHDGYRGAGTELWLTPLPSGHLPLRPIER
ncbi:MAG: hypothetical protein JJ863_27840 [Deltaproteobacteria bacterium]|nr:hypothetical protein [Deltaproteobacteria bacterium]